METGSIKFSDLLLFLEDKIAQVADDATASFKKRAYSVVIQKIQQSHDLNDIATESKINNLTITQNMKTHLIEWIHSTKRHLQRLMKLRAEKEKAQKKNTEKKAIEKKTSEKNQPALEKATKPPKPAKSSKKSLSPDEVLRLKKELTSIVGIGAVGAKKLIEQGVRSVDDLHQINWFSTLPESAQIFLKYHPDRRIPHEHMVKLEPLITSFPKAKILMVGSFRRETQFSRDFDVMLISDNPKSLLEYEEWLSKQFAGKTYKYSSGEDRISFLIEIPKKLLNTDADMVYKFDIFRTPKSNQYSMLLYSTGSKIFNIKMRARAKKMGYLLNQDGLFTLNVDGKPDKKLDIRSERGFFTILDMPYLAPKNRE